MDCESCLDLNGKSDMITRTCPTYPQHTKAWSIFAPGFLSLLILKQTSQVHVRHHRFH